MKNEQKNNPRRTGIMLTLISAFYCLGIAICATGLALNSTPLNASSGTGGGAKNELLNTFLWIGATTLTVAFLSVLVYFALRKAKTTKNKV